MARTIDLTIPHQRTREEVRQKIASAVAQAHQQHANLFNCVSETWQGDRLDFRIVAMGQTITGHANVRDDAVQLQVDLPWMLAMLADKIRPALEREGRKLLD
jgi:hypothetical protein